MPGTGFFRARGALFFLRFMFPDISGFGKLLPNLIQIRFALCLLQECFDRFQLIDICLCLMDQLTQSIVGSLQLFIFFIIALGIFGSGLIGIQRDLHLFVIVVVIRHKRRGRSRLDPVRPGMQELSIQTELIAFFGILQLPSLQIQLFCLPLQHGVDQVSEIRAFLTDPGDIIFLCIVGLENLRDGTIAFRIQVRVHGQGHAGKLDGSALRIVDDIRAEMFFLHILHQFEENSAKVKLFFLGKLLRALVTLNMCPAAKLLGNHRADPGIGLVNRLIDGQWF